MATSTSCSRRCARRGSRSFSRPGLSSNALELALDLSRKAAALLKERGIENGRLDAELLLADVLGIDRLKLYLQHDRPVTPPELELFRAHIRRRLKREPVQYILGRQPFRKLDLKVDHRALIPRPETEVLAGAVLAWLTERALAGRAAVLDLGTGTGALALSLAQEGGCTVTATDISAESLELARENVAKNDLGEQVMLRHGDLWGPIGEHEVFDVIVSNPPYVAESERPSLAPEVVDYEPAGALFAQGDGLAILSAIIKGAPAHLRAGGLLALEMGASQGATVIDVLKATGRYATPRLVRDLAGRDRIVLAEAV